MSQDGIVGIPGYSRGELEVDLNKDDDTQEQIDFDNEARYKALEHFCRILETRAAQPKSKENTDE